TGPTTRYHRRQRKERAMHDLPWARTERSGTDPRPRWTLAELPRAATLRFSARHAGRSMEPADGDQCEQADARRHGGASRLRGVPSALNRRGDTELPVRSRANAELAVIDLKGGSPPTRAPGQGWTPQTCARAA